jgi:hypothetical protein
MLSSCLADDLTSDFGRSRSLFSEKSALIFSRTFRDRAVGAYCMVEGAATDRFGGPPINRATRGGVDPIPLRLPPIAVARASVAFSLLHVS